MAFKFVEKTLGDLLDEVAAKHPDQPGVIYTDRDYRKTYKEFRDEVDIIARGFMALGIKRGDHVAIWATNHHQWLLTMFATAKIGAVMVTVNTAYKIFEVEYLLRQSDSMTLIFMDHYRKVDYVGIINELNPDLKNQKPGESDFEQFPHLRNLIYFGGEKAPDGMFHWDDLYELANKVSPEELKARQASLSCYDVVNMQYTSGTTGFPKGVMLTHSNILNNGQAIGDCMAFSEKDCLCIPVPFYHCFGMVLAVLASVTHAATMVPIEQYEPVAVMTAIQQEKCTAVHGVPTMYINILDHPRFDEFDFSTLRTGIMAGSPCPIKIMQQVIDKMHMSEITITYGQTEASPACTMTNTNDSVERRVSTVGRSMPFAENKIVDPDTGEEVPVGVSGEFVTRGPHVMKGYYKMPEATAQAIDKDGWLHTGDMAAVDEDGYYKITGRLKDMIIRGGENLYPLEIEEFLYTHPAVGNVQVVGVPSRKYGEEVMAYIIVKEGHTLTEEEIRAYSLERMARHKVPQYFRFIEQLPLTGSGKVQKFKLREMAIEDLSLHEEANIETA
ncbi:MAG: AMP-binding protein [Firmicutes bacterium]|nr:AMP-binding protein [Bacillota bacterium]